MTTFQDIFKSSFLERLDSVSLLDTALALVLAFLLGLFIFLVYKRSYSGVMYSPSFGVTLIALTLITTLLILAVTSNIVLSLGMVGALSIVRFRTAVKEPKDLLFLFWSIGIGIILGARNYELALLISIVVTILLFLLELVPEGRMSVLLVVNMDREGKEAELLPAVQKLTQNFKVKSRNRTMDGTDLIVECRTRQESELLDAVSSLDHVLSASVISHDGEAVY